MFSGKKIMAEAVTVVCGAILAAAIVGQLPILKNWIKSQWN